MGIGLNYCQYGILYLDSHYNTGPYINFPHFGNSNLGKLPYICVFMYLYTYAYSMSVKRMIGVPSGSLLNFAVQLQNKHPFFSRQQHRTLCKRSFSSKQGARTTTNKIMVVHFLYIYTGILDRLKSRIGNHLGVSIKLFLLVLSKD